MEHLKSFELFENANTNPQTLKDLKKAMRKASNDRNSGVYGIFANPSTWGTFQYAPNEDIWLQQGQMSVLATGDDTSSIERANKFLNPLGWNMVKGEHQRTVVVKKLEA
jgi:hypothetical protein